MFEFVNPGFLVAGGALVSSPIIIHLINRLRYKRVRWAAMEFLLKSQKKNRRRLIIEQMILLLLRCLLVVMAVWLVSRLLAVAGLSLGSADKQKTIHYVLLDDSLSMNDWVDDRKHSDCKTAFETAKKVIAKEISDKVGKSSTPQELVVIVASDLDLARKRFEQKLANQLARGTLEDLWLKVLAIPDQVDPDLRKLIESKKLMTYKPEAYKDLRDKKNRDQLVKELAERKCSLLHVPMLDSVKLVRELANANKTDKIVVHLVSDFRQKDWSTTEARELCGEVKKLATLKDGDLYKVKLNLVDVAHPYRERAEDAPKHHDNIGITEFYPETRVAAAGTSVRFWVTIHNFSSTVKEARIALFDPESGEPLRQFEAGTILHISPGQLTTKIDAIFQCNQEPDPETGKLKDIDTYRQISARLEMSAERNQGRDGLDVDDVRYAAILVRPKIPVLIVDGDPKRGRRDGGDYHHIAEALDSAPGSGFEIIPNPEKREGVEGVDLLNQPNLEKYPSIYLLNVPTFTPDQAKNLQNYVRNGGSVAFFLGKNVDPIKYNTQLYKEDGTGLFPVELSSKYFPPEDEPPLKPNLDDGHYKVLLRLDNFPNKDKFPIFWMMYEGKQPMVEFLKYLPIRRYFQAANYKPRPGVLELATMPNEKPVSTYAAGARGIRAKVLTLADDRRFSKYSTVLRAYANLINKALEKDKKGQDKRLFELADALDHLLNDRGGKDAGEGEGQLKMSSFWNDNEELREEVTRLWKEVRYGSPLVLASMYGRGRVVVVMTTAGKEWTDWAGGAEPASWSYPPMILEMQSYLTSMGSEGNLLVGNPLRFELDSSLYDRKIKRTFFRPRLEKNADDKSRKTDRGEDFADDRDPKKHVYVVDNALTPGFYRFDLTLLTGKEGKSKGEVEERGVVFNVDTMNEGDLRRVSRDMLMKNNLQGAPTENLKLREPFGWGDSLIDRQTDFSKSTWFYLIFLLILIAEQAMAVHLSFHLRDSESALPGQAVRSQAMTA